MMRHQVFELSVCTGNAISKIACMNHCKTNESIRWTIDTEGHHFEQQNLSRQLNDQPSRAWNSLPIVSDCDVTDHIPTTDENICVQIESRRSLCRHYYYCCLFASLFVVLIVVVIVVVIHHAVFTQPFCYSTDAQQQLVMKRCCAVFLTKKHCCVAAKASWRRFHLLRRTVLTGLVVYVSSFVIEIDCLRLPQLLLAALPEHGAGSGMLRRLLPLLVLPVAATDVLRAEASTRPLSPPPGATRSVTRTSGCRCRAISASMATARKHWSREDGFRRRAEDVTSTRPAERSAADRLTQLNRTAPLITNAPSINYLLLSPLVDDRAIAVPSAPQRFTDRRCAPVRPPVALFKSLWLMESDGRPTQLGLMPEVSKSKLTVRAR